MNKARKKRVDSVVARLTDLQTELEEIKADAETALENVPENLQGGQRAADLEDEISALEECSSNLEGVITDLSNLE